MGKMLYICYNCYKMVKGDKVTKMIKKMLYNNIEIIGKYNDYSDEQIEQIKYVLTLLVYELIKLSAVISIYSAVGYFKEILSIIIIMSITKPFIGGYHEDSQMKCFIATVILSGFIINLSNSQLSISSYITLNILSVFAVYNQAPIIDLRMPLTKENLIKRNKRIAVISYCFLGLISIFTYRIHWLSSIILWTNLVQAVLMFNKYKNKEV